MSSMKIREEQVKGCWLPDAAIFALVLLSLCSSLVQGFVQSDPPSTTHLNTPSRALSSDGYTDDVQWDQYSLVVKGQRLFLQ